MPIYEFVCPKCGHKFELLRRLSQVDEGASCPECQQTARRIMSTFACFSSNGGSTAPIAGSGSSCASCGASNCATCAG